VDPNPLNDLRRLLLAGLDLTNKAGMRDAQIARLAAHVGISLEIPEKPEADVTSDMREHILRARACCTEFEWLMPDGPRDQICTRYGISRQQVAGVLAADTQRGNGNGIHAGNGKDQVPSTITDDPATWPHRPGPRPVAPKLDEKDWEIAQAVMKAGRWNELRNQIANTRLLTRQQVAGMKAVLSKGQTPAVLRSAT
jgi:hypothetical protein